MVHGRGYYCSTVAAIEDADGVDGLAYKQSRCNSMNSPSGKRVHFTRPPASARVSLFPGPLARSVRRAPLATQSDDSNKGELGSDTFDLFSTVRLAYDVLRGQWSHSLTDSDGDDTVDTGVIAQGSSTTIVVQVAVPGTASATRGQSNNGQLTARSSLNTSKSRTAPIRVAVPAPFAQGYSKNRLPRPAFIGPAGQITRQTSNRLATTPRWQRRRTARSSRCGPEWRYQ